MPGARWRGDDLGEAGLQQPQPGGAQREVRPAGGAPGEAGEHPGGLQRGPAGQGEAAVDGGSGASLLSPDSSWQDLPALQAGGL